MNNQVNESLKTTVSFVVENLSSEQKRLCMFPGHYNTSKVEVVEDKAYIVRTSPDALKSVGYECDEVADDHNPALIGKYIFKVVPKSKRTRLVDLVDFVKHSELEILKIRLTDLSNDATHEFFNHEIEIAGSEIGTKGASDVLQMSTYVNPRNVQLNVIEMDFEQEPLSLDSNTVFIIDVPGNGKFQIDYILG